VEARSVCIDWAAANPVKILEELFARSFRISRHGIIDLPGVYDAASPPAHREAFSDVARALRTGGVTLAGWAYPGAVARHIAVKATDLRYNARLALCACFALVGCVSYQAPQTGGGVLIIPEPTDLVRFARTRTRLTPRRVVDAYIPGAADGVLAVHLALRMDDIAHAEGGVGNVHGVQLKALPWATQQKSRYRFVNTRTFNVRELDQYAVVRRTLPSRLRIRRADGTVFGTASALRGFITENLALRQRWYSGFATATDGGPEGRFVHYYRERDNLGALFPEEREGLIVMLDQLEPAEISLVRAVHMALRHRFAAIADETPDNPVLRGRRWQGERDRWRHAFAGSRTPEQIRAALADLWSRAGRNPELQDHWRDVLPLLRPAHWKAARDLALVALASYGRAGDDMAEGEAEAEAEAEAEE
jgi:CRISPR-associated protein Cas8a1/Csx13